MKKSISLSLALSVLAIVAFSTFGSADTGNAATVLKAYADDTIAGMDSSISVPKLKPGQSVYIEVERDDGMKILVGTSADNSGVADYTIDGKYLTKSGTYHVAIKSTRDSLPGPFTKFEVFPSDLEVKNTLVEKDNADVRPNGSDQANVTVTLNDKYFNPIAYHQVQLISTRKADSVEYKSDRFYTDVDGSVNFTVSSTEPGLSRLYAYDITENKMIADDIEIEFGGDTNVMAYGGDPKSLSAYEQSDFVYTLSEDGNKFVFPNFPDTVNLAEPFSFTLEIQNAANQVEKSYLGTVHFSVPGAQVGDVVLPVDYTYTVEDQGSHTFSLSMQFQKEGQYKLVVQDADTPELMTEQSVTVGSGKGSSAFHASGAKVLITEPKPGTYSTPSQVIQGSSSPGLSVKLYDNDKEIASVNTDVQGKFTYTTPALTEGKHTFYAVAVSSTGEIINVSDDVNVTIDISGPAITDVKVEPSTGLNPEQYFTIEFKAEESLSQVVAKFQGDNIEMQPVEGQANVYKANIKSPKEFGSYPISLLLVDSLGNQTTTENVSQVTVGNGGEFVAAVPRVEAYPSDGKITLMWEKPSSTLALHHYRIYYGETPEILNQIVDTSTSEATWYIPNLQNGKEYFFAVTALDEKGNESAQKSAVVSSKPFATQTEQPKNVDVVPVDQSTLNDTPEVQGDTGPGVWGLLLVSIILANFAFGKRSGLSNKC